MRRNIEEKIVFLTNTLGSFILAGLFFTSKGIVNILIGTYFIINLLCFISLIGLYNKKGVTKWKSTR